MSGKLLARRQRLARVRSAQHTLAVAERVEAEAKASTIENNARRLRQVRTDLFQAPPQQMGASFAAYRELADRLERAGKQLEGALYDANRVVGEKHEKQAAANRDKEIAKRLRARAQEQLEDWREMKLSQLPNNRVIQSRGPK
jgi:hypothetical protein